jgi:hypothetical protein
VTLVNFAFNGHILFDRIPQGGAVGRPVLNLLNTRRETKEGFLSILQGSRGRLSLLSQAGSSAPNMGGAGAVWKYAGTATRWPPMDAADANNSLRGPINVATMAHMRDEAMRDSC